MYPNLNAEISRKNITIEDMAKAIDKSVNTMYAKLRGQYPITLTEAVKIKTCIGTNLSLDVLFSEEAIEI